MSTEGDITRGQVMRVALPIILSNLSTPLLGLVDTAVIGNLGDPALIGAVALGGLVFSFLYWGFGFLRMGTTGLVAQARGAMDLEGMRAALYRALALGVLIGLTLMALQRPIALLAFRLTGGSDAVESEAMTYFNIRIWAAPVSLGHLAVLGYLLGQQRAGAILGLQLVLNGTNIVLDFVLVVGLDMGVAGLALATVAAEVLAFALGLALVTRHMRREAGSLKLPLEKLNESGAWRRMLTVNGDIMVRTLCLIFIFAWFTNQGAKAGDVLLATNAILMQFVTFAAFFLDGYALAGETLVGSAIGARNRALLMRTLRHVTELGLVTAVALCLAFAVTGGWVIDLLTNVPEVRDAGRDYLPWAIAAPVVALWCYLLDGVFIGATRTAEMRSAMLASLAIFMLGWYLTTPLGNHGLWLALHIHFVARALTLARYLPRIP